MDENKNTEEFIEENISANKTVGNFSDDDIIDATSNAYKYGYNLGKKIVDKNILEEILKSKENTNSSTQDYSYKQPELKQETYAKRSNYKFKYVYNMISKTIYGWIIFKKMNQIPFPLRIVTIVGIDTLASEVFYHWIVDVLKVDLNSDNWETDLRNKLDKLFDNLKSKKKRKAVIYHGQE